MEPPEKMTTRRRTAPAVDPALPLEEPTRYADEAERIADATITGPPAGSTLAQVAPEKRDEKPIRPATLAEALVAVQKAMPAIPKDAVNPHFNSRFTSWDTLIGTVLPLLNRNGFALIQQPTSIPGIDGANESALKTVLLHAPSGEQISSTMPLLLSKHDPQGQAAAITYARRYALSSLLAIAADTDDDGAQASPRGRTAAPAYAPEGELVSPLLLKELTAALNDVADVQGWSEPEVLRQCRVSFKRDVTAFDQLTPAEAATIIAAAKAAKAAS